MLGIGYACILLAGTKLGKQRTLVTTVHMMASAGSRAVYSISSSGGTHSGPKNSHLPFPFSTVARSITPSSRAL